MVREVSPAEFFQELNSNDGVVVLDIWADWCGPCSYMAPVLDKLQISNLEELTVLKMNVDKNMGFAQELNIMDIPTILVLKDGNIVDTIVGQMPYEELAAKVATHTL